MNCQSMTIAALAVFVQIVSASAQIVVTEDYGKGAEFRLQRTPELGVVQWGNGFITIDQVVDENNAIIEFWGISDSNVPQGKPIKLWFQGPTKGLVDGRSFRTHKMVTVRKNGTKTYETVLGGPKTIIAVKHFSDEEMTEIYRQFRTENPKAVELTTNDGVSSFVVIDSYENGGITFRSIAGTGSIKLKDLDRDSKSTVKEWRKKNR